MEQEKRKIALYKTRTFSEKMNDTFDFLRENWRQLGLWLTYLLLPVSLLMAVCLNTMVGNYMSLMSNMGSGHFERIDSATTMLVYLGTMVLSFLVTALGISTTYAAMRLYEERPTRLAGLTLRDAQPLVTRGVLRMLVLTIVSSVIAVVVFIMMMLLTMVFVGTRTGFGIMLTLPLYLLVPVCLVPLTLTAPVYLFEDDLNPLQAFAKAWRLGWATWGGVAAVLIVLGVLCYLVAAVLSIPFYSVFIARLVTLQEGGMVEQPSLMASVWQYVLSVLMGFVSSVLGCVVYVGLAYQYGHACDKVDGKGMDREIETFEEL